MRALAGRHGYPPGLGPQVSQRPLPPSPSRAVGGGGDALGAPTGPGGAGATAQPPAAGVVPGRRPPPPPASAPAAAAPPPPAPPGCGYAPLQLSSADSRLTSTYFPNGARPSTCCTACNNNARCVVWVAYNSYCELYTHATFTGQADDPTVAVGHSRRECAWGLGGACRLPRTPPCPLPLLPALQPASWGSRGTTRWGASATAAQATGTTPTTQSAAHAPPLWSWTIAASTACPATLATTSPPGWASSRTA